MAFFLSMLKAKKIGRLRRDLEAEKIHGFKTSQSKRVKRSLRQRYRHFWLDVRRNIKKCIKRICFFPKRSCMYRTIYKATRDDTCENFTIKSIIGFISGYFLTYIFFMFFVFILNFKLSTATIMCSFFGTILTLGLAFSYKVRCVVFLLLPQFFSKRGRQALMAYAFILAITGPAKNTLNNMGILSESLACGQEQLKVAVKQILEVIKKPFYAIRDAIKAVVKTVKEIVKKIKEVLLTIKRTVMSILNTIKSAFQFLGKLLNMCNKELGTPFERCERVFENAVADCNAKLGPYFDWLCSITYLVKSVCYIVKVLDLICIVIEFVNDSVIGIVVRKIKIFVRHIRTMFYVRIKFSHSFHFETNQSKSMSEITTGIVTEIRHRTEHILTVFDFMSCATSLFFLFIILRVLHYRYKFLTNERFDNRFITDDFRKIDLRRAQMEKETILPLNHRERTRYITVRSIRLIKSERVKLSKAAVILGTTTFKLLTHMMADYALYWVLTVIRYHAKFQSSVKAPNVVGVHVDGKGFLADLLRSIVKAFQPLGVNFEIDTIPCLPDPLPPDYDRYIQIVVLLMLCWILTIFEPYGLRLRHSVMCYYHPTRARQRALWLYNQILRSRLSFLKYARRQLKRKVAGSRGVTNITCMEFVRAHVRWKWLLFFLGSDHQEACVLCGEVFRKSDATKPIRCANPGCMGIYCKQCFEDLGNLCTMCLQPAQYGDLSDVSEEQDSSEDPTPTIKAKKARRKRKRKQKRKRCTISKCLKKDHDSDSDTDKDGLIKVSPETTDSDYYTSGTATDHSYSYQNNKDITGKPPNDINLKFADKEKQNIPDYASWGTLDTSEECICDSDTASDTTTDSDATTSSGSSVSKSSAKPTSTKSTIEISKSKESELAFIKNNTPISTKTVSSETINAVTNYDSKLNRSKGMSQTSTVSPNTTTNTSELSGDSIITQFKADKPFEETASSFNLVSSDSSLLSQIDVITRPQNKRRSNRERKESEQVYNMFPVGIDYHKHKAPAIAYLDKINIPTINGKREKRLFGKNTKKRSDRPRIPVSKRFRTARAKISQKRKHKKKTELPFNVTSSSENIQRRVASLKKFHEGIIKKLQEKNTADILRKRKSPRFRKLNSNRSFTNTSRHSKCRLYKQTIKFCKETYQKAKEKANRMKDRRLPKRFADTSPAVRHRNLSTGSTPYSSEEAIKITTYTFSGIGKRHQDIILRASSTSHSSIISELKNRHIKESPVFKSRNGAKDKRQQPQFQMRTSSNLKSFQKATATSLQSLSSDVTYESSESVTTTGTFSSDSKTTFIESPDSSDKDFSVTVNQCIHCGKTYQTRKPAVNTNFNTEKCRTCANKRIQTHYTEDNCEISKTDVRVPPLNLNFDSPRHPARPFNHFKERVKYEIVQETSRSSSASPSRSPRSPLNLNYNVYVPRFDKFIMCSEDCKKGETLDRGTTSKKVNELRHLQRAKRMQYLLRTKSAVAQRQERKKHLVHSNPAATGISKRYLKTFRKSYKTRTNKAKSPHQPVNPGNSNTEKTQKRRVENYYRKIKNKQPTDSLSDVTEDQNKFMKFIKGIFRKAKGEVVSTPPKPKLLLEPCELAKSSVLSQASSCSERYWYTTSSSSSSGDGSLSKDDTETSMRSSDHSLMGSSASHNRGGGQSTIESSEQSSYTNKIRSNLSREAPHKVINSKQKNRKNAFCSDSELSNIDIYFGDRKPARHQGRKKFDEADIILGEKKVTKRQARAPRSFSNRNSASELSMKKSSTKAVRYQMIEDLDELAPRYSRQPAERDQDPDTSEVKLTNRFFSTPALQSYTVLYDVTTNTSNTIYDRFNDIEIKPSTTDNTQAESKSNMDMIDEHYSNPHMDCPANCYCRMKSKRSSMNRSRESSRMRYSNDEKPCSVKFASRTETHIPREYVGPHKSSSRIGYCCTHNSKGGEIRNYVPEYSAGEPNKNFKYENENPYGHEFCMCNAFEISSPRRVMDDEASYDSGCSGRSEFPDLVYQNTSEFEDLVNELGETLSKRNKDRVRRAMHEFELKSRQNKNLDKPLFDSDSEEQMSIHRRRPRCCCHCQKQRSYEEEPFTQFPRFVPNEQPSYAQKHGYVNKLVEYMDNNSQNTSNLSVPVKQSKKPSKNSHWEMDQRTGEWYKALDNCYDFEDECYVSRPMTPRTRQMCGCERTAMRYNPNRRQAFNTTPRSCVCNKCGYSRESMY